MECVLVEREEDNGKRYFQSLFRKTGMSQFYFLKIKERKT